ncbi:MAG: hypothetical protein NTW30_05495, partial [Candidatus Aenigmarchaeota archaeon]|nr:hypothetical protein [Candidatus Aenigmarchaeota archaeon]
DFASGANTIDTHSDTTVLSNYSTGGAGIVWSNPYGVGGWYVNMSNSRWLPVEFYPTDGIRRCGIDTCVSDDDGGLNQASYNIYWEQYVSTGLPGGLYQNTIEVGAWPYTKTPCDTGC